MNDYIYKHNFPEDLKSMSYDELELLSYELRDFLVESVSKTGGHLSSNLGVVELTMALHKCFDTPVDKVIWDVGHQTYIHKILTGRAEGFKNLRQYGGMSGFPKTCESEYDLFDTGHSSSSISLGLGMATARDLKGEKYHVVSVIGDGSMTGGMAFEALNNAGNSKSNFIVILNDNGMSISPNTGGLSKSLGRIRSTDKYIHTKTQIKKGISKVPVIGDGVVSGIHHAKENIKYAIIDGILFEELGFKYLGPVNGHNIKELCEMLEQAKGIQGPVLIHAVTKKGKGYTNAEANPDKFHGVGPFDVETGKTAPGSKGRSFSKVFGDKMIELAQQHLDIATVSAAMVSGVGLSDFYLRFPSRTFDVGIAEGHAVAFAAGLAKAGTRPYVAIYSSFLQRAYDQIIEDVCLQKLPVVFCIDRAGVVGADGETHHGLFDISYLKSMPNMTLMCPSSAEELEEMLENAYKLGAPCAIRYPRGNAPESNKDKLEGLKGRDAVILSVGTMTNNAIEAAEILKDKGIDAGIENLTTLVPLDEDYLRKIASETDLIVTVEDGMKVGGIGETISSILVESGTKVVNMGWPDKFIEHGTQNQLYQQYGLDAAGIASTVINNMK